MRKICNAAPNQKEALRMLKKSLYHRMIDTFPRIGLEHCSPNKFGTESIRRSGKVACNQVCGIHPG